ncbi:unnamed protein product [Paramecium octaurelia]|uniref:Uncharacterized protein n=1 Tax=Paramecium octaurelia TaxID=43137 RepID=A0A8S1YCC2_PAROT|nr:unnamed protein product [Paramecium octaurelia]
MGKLLMKLMFYYQYPMKNAVRKHPFEQQYEQHDRELIMSLSYQIINIFYAMIFAYSKILQKKIM